MEQRSQFPVHHYAVKAAIRRLIHKLGGVESAALVPGVSFGKSAISNWQNPDQPSWPPLNVVAIWEADIGEPIVTRAMMGLAGEAPHVPVDPRTRFAGAMAEVGALAQSVIDAMSDGVISETERRTICKEAEDAIDLIQKLKRDVSCDVPHNIIPPSARG